MVMRSDCASDDAALFKRWRECNDHKAFNELYARHNAELLRMLIASRGLAPDAADDVAQQTWLAAITAEKQIDSFSGWLFKTAGNLALKHHRYERSRKQLHCGCSVPEAEFEDQEGEAPEADAEFREMIGVVLQEKATLPWVENAAIRAVYYQDYTCDEYAEYIGVTGKTVRQRIRKGLNRLREPLDALLAVS